MSDLMPLNVLTKRQQEYVEKMCLTDGTDAQIGAALRVSPGAVKQALLVAREKVGVRTRVHLAIWAIRVGLV